MVGLTGYYMGKLLKCVVNEDPDMKKYGFSTNMEIIHKVYI